MKGLLGWYKGLPREMQMLVAMAGFGTPVTIIYTLSRLLHLPTIVVVIGAAVVIGVIALVSFLIPKLFSRSARKRAKKMEAELVTRGEAGPVSMDLRAAIKANNEKFFGAIKDMRKLGISVYDLPWYIVIGDSGCGKTKLINEGGLTFSTGKPEGYQLGTLNYNWWFTEDAIFVDMAGRLCNPQEDADRREWEAFLKTVALGRRGYPINGVLCCVSAEHLLADPPEKHEQDANVMLERLRDLQNKLGVTFATYLVVTKCDKIVGFMQFFDRAERDITIKNQIFGWSRPGDFNELRDPELFAADFDGIYGRLNELRLRRLNDEIDDFELGMAYSFPEEFRQLKEPLQTYVRTLFPAIKSPRAVKNLIFRGVYFTSATQQGGLILRHLSERLGADAAAQFPPLESMYPRPRPHFVKDLLFRKVFPEQGLVFRNEQEVLRNRRLARLLTVGTAVLGVALVATLIISSVQFGRLISTPRERAQRAPAATAKPVESLMLVAQLGQATDTLKGSILPYILSLGVGADRPVQDLTRIQMRLFEQGVLRPLLLAVDHGLRTAPLVAAGAEAAATRGGIPFEQFLPALQQYVAWYACAGEKTLPAHIDYASFEKLAGGAPTSDDPLLSQRSQVLEQGRRYFTAVVGAKGWGNPAGLLAGKEVDPTLTIKTGLTKLHGYLERYAVLSDQHPDPVIREWSRIRDRCAQIQTAYEALLAAAEAPIETQEQLEDFRRVFNENYDRLIRAMNECAWSGPKSGGFVRIPPLRPALLKQRDMWVGIRDQLAALYASCGGPAEPAKDPIGKATAALVAGDEQELRGLDRVLAENLRESGLAERGYFPEYYGDSFEKVVREVDQSFGHILVLTRGGEAARDDELRLSDELAGPVRGVLDKVHSRLAAELGERGADTTRDWVRTLQGLLYPEKGEAETAPDAETLAKLSPSWQPEKLRRLSLRYQDLIRKGTGTVLLQAIEARLRDAGPWTLAEHTPAWKEMQRSSFAIAAPTAVEIAPAKRDEVAPPPPTKAPGGPPPLVPPVTPPAGPTTPPAGSATPPVTAAAERSAAPGAVPGYATPDFLNARAMECVQLVRFLADFGPQYYFARAGESPPLNQRCADLVVKAWKLYCDSYVAAWNTAYADASLARLERLARTDLTWEPFAAQFRPGAARPEDVRAAVRDEFEPALAEVLHALRWATYAEGGWWLEQPDAYYGPAKRQIASQLETALRERWKHGEFVRKAAAPRGAAAQTRPWEALAAEFGNRWLAWCDAVGRTTIPRQFGPADAAVTPGALPWNEIPGLRAESNLGDEQITQRLVDFQRKAQAVLSAELTSVYCGIQRDSFGELAPYDGWPYLNEAGSGPGALDTVRFEDFTKFLATVQRAEAALRQLEEGLPDEDLRRARRAFVRSCEEWRNFLGLTAQGAATVLEVNVWTEDPLGEPLGREPVDDTAQHYYRTVQLALGLRLAAGESTAARPLEFQTVERGRARTVRAFWEWTRVPDQQELTFALVDGIRPEGQNFQFPNINPRVLGKPSPLALCAYLHRYGRYADGNWVVTHGVNLAASFEEVKRKELVPEIRSGKPLVGEKFMFQLQSGRVLPAPIAKLNLPTGP